MANASPGVRVMLSGNRTGLHLEVVPKSDGTFEFAKVPVDTYSVRFMPRIAATSSKTIAVTGRGDATVNLSIPAKQNVALKISANDGSEPPNVSLVLTLSKTEAYTILLLAVPVVVRSVDEFVFVGDTYGPSGEATAEKPTVTTISKSDGRYSLRLPEGEYRIDVPTPAGKLLSILAGETDLRQVPLRIGPGGSQEIVVSLQVK